MGSFYAKVPADARRFMRNLLAEDSSKAEALSMISELEAHLALWRRDLDREVREAFDVEERELMRRRPR